MSKQARIPQLSFEGNDLSLLPALMEGRATRLDVSTVNWPQDYSYRPIVVVDVAYCSRGILLHYTVRGWDMRTLSEGDGHYVHTDSCVEFFMQATEGEAYKNFEFNAAGVCYASHHASPKVGEPLSPEEYASILRRATYQGQKISEDNVLHTWELSALIPWQVMGLDGAQIPSQIRANFYKCADDTAHPHFLSWAPIDEPAPAFHRPQFFGTLILE